VRNTDETPEYVRSFARDCIDAGADLFVGTGPHVLRGMEMYRGRPMLYSLGNFAYQTETIERLPAESYDYYGVDDATDPAALFRSRYRDANGNPKGSLARDGYWETIVPVCEFEDGELASLRLYPCSLGQDRALPRRGTPALASGDRAEEILARFAALSKPFGTELSIEDGSGSSTAEPIAVGVGFGGGSRQSGKVVRKARGSVEDDLCRAERVVPLCRA